MRFPNLFIVGAPKCGTTSLVHYLNQHPDIFIHPNEQWFFAPPKSESLKGLYNTKAKNLSAYLQRFANNNEKYIGEKTPLYLYYDNALKEIHEYNPNANIIVCIREPLSFLRSIYHFHCQIFRIQDADFISFLTRELQSIQENINLPWKNGCSWKMPNKSQKYEEQMKFDITKRCLYNQHIQNIYKIFPKENVHVVIYDRLKESPTQTVQDIFSFLSVPSYAIDCSTKHNVTTLPRKRKIQRFLESLISPLGIYNNANKKKLEYQTMPEDLKNKLMDLYRPEVAALSKTIGVDLVKLWGY